jgi:hypothetical protein
VFKFTTLTNLKNFNNKLVDEIAKREILSTTLQQKLEERCADSLIVSLSGGLNMYCISRKLS